MATADEIVRDAEARALFRGLENLHGLLLAVSGGPDSTALLVIAARWARRLKRPPKLVAATVDHGLRPEGAREAAAVKKLARTLGVPHRTLRWHGRKPKTGLQEAARLARYRLLAEAAARAQCDHILTAHTLDDQAETVFFRLARGSGLTGLAGMAHAAVIPFGGKASVAKTSGARTSGTKTSGTKTSAGKSAIFLVRPFLAVPKARLVATLTSAGIAHSDDPSNSDPRFTRTRLRTLLPQLAGEGLDARGLARFAARMRRADATIEFAVTAARAALAPGPWRAGGPVVFETSRFAALPTEVALRLLGRAIAHAGNEGPVELGKLELLYEALRTAQESVRRTLAGALVTLRADHLTVERAPPRRGKAKSKRKAKAKPGGGWRDDGTHRA